MNQWCECINWGIITLSISAADWLHYKIFNPAFKDTSVQPSFLLALFLINVLILYWHWNASMGVGLVFIVNGALPDFM